MLEIPIVAGVNVRNQKGRDVRAIGSIIDSEGNVIVFDENGDRIPDDKASNRISKLLKHEFSITHMDDEGKAHKVGKLVMYTYDQVFERVKGALILILINSAIIIAALWVVFLTFIRKILGRPLGRLTAAVEELSFDNLGNQKIDIEVYERNELKILEESFNKMTDKLSGQVEALKDAQEELIRKEKLAVLGMLGSSIGHELRNPLGVINNAAYFINMKMKTIEDDAVKDNIKIITREVDTANKIITGILDFSRIKQAVGQETDINELVTNALSKSLIPQTITVKTEFAEEMTPVFVDPVQVGQVFLNLIENAVHAMEQGETLSIYSKAANGETEIVFVDEGCGIAENKLERIFEPLFTTRAKGIGLGLAVSKSLIEANEGTILVESKEGKGSKFTVKFSRKD